MARRHFSRQLRQAIHSRLLGNLGLGQNRSPTRIARRNHRTSSATLPGSLFPSNRGWLGFSKIEPGRRPARQVGATAFSRPSLGRAERCGPIRSLRFSRLDRTTWPISWACAPASRNRRSAGRNVCRSRAPIRNCPSESNRNSRANRLLPPSLDGIARGSLAGKQPAYRRETGDNGRRRHPPYDRRKPCPAYARTYPKY
jgi:hypothetical protein